MPNSRVGALERYLASLRASASEAPSFYDVRMARELATTPEEQQRLAVEDRRAFAREYVQANPVRGTIAMGILAPAEQGYKWANSLIGRKIGRSGYFEPMANIGAAYQGTLEGLATRGMRK